LTKLINLLGVLGFLLSAGLTTGALVLYMKLPGIIADAKLELTEMVTSLIPIPLPVDGLDGDFEGLPLPKESSDSGVPKLPF